MVDLKNRKWSKHAKAAGSINVETKAYFSERVRHIIIFYLDQIYCLDYRLFSLFSSNIQKLLEN